MAKNERNQGFKQKAARYHGDEQRAAWFSSIGEIDLVINHTTDRPRLVRDFLGNQRQAEESHELRRWKFRGQPVQHLFHLPKLLLLLTFTAPCALQQTEGDGIVGHGDHPQHTAGVRAGVLDELIERGGEGVVQVGQFLLVSGSGREQLRKLLALWDFPWRLSY